MIKTNYALSLLLHSLIIFYFLIFFEFNKPKKLDRDSINVSFESLPIIKKSEKNHLENNSFPPKKEEKKIEINKKKTTSAKSKIKTIPSKKKEEVEKKQIIEKENNIQKDNKEVQAPPEKKNNPKPKNNLNNYEIKQNKESANILNQTFSKNETKTFNDYNDALKALIQKKAAQNYPPASLRRNEEGMVELIFSIDMNGNIFNINIGKKTNSSERLINSSIKTLNLISPYKKNNILKKKNTFSIIIVYKLR